MARIVIRTCKICQMVKVNNTQKDYDSIPIITKNNFEKIFIYICRPFPCSRGHHQLKYIIIILDHNSKCIKLYPVNRATTMKIVQIITDQYTKEEGKLMAVITDHVHNSVQDSGWRNYHRVVKINL